MKLWKGASFVGYWKSVFLILDDKALLLTASLEDEPMFRVNIEVVEFKDVKDSRFIVRTGPGTSSSRRTPTGTKQVWFYAL